MREINFGEVKFDGGKPKICVPVVRESLPQILKDISSFSALPVDILEWRMDYYTGDLTKVISKVYSTESIKPLICTLRTRHDGGRANITYREYGQIISAIIDTGCLDVIDIELSAGDIIVSELINRAKEKGIATIVSKHNFEFTPSVKEMLSDYKKMVKLGADMPKYAVMPRGTKDVLKLFEASLEASSLYGPITAISMGPLGKISRVSGEYFGSAMTFAKSGEGSAPGQMDAEDLNAVLNDLRIDS